MAITFANPELEKERIDLAITRDTVSEYLRLTEYTRSAPDRAYALFPLLERYCSDASYLREKIIDILPHGDAVSTWYNAAKESLLKDEDIHKLAKICEHCRPADRTSTLRGLTDTFNGAVAGIDSNRPVKTSEFTALLHVIADYQCQPEILKEYRLQSLHSGYHAMPILPFARKHAA